MGGGVLALRMNFFVYLAVPPAHLWECCYLALGLEGLSIFNGVQLSPVGLSIILSICKETHLLFTAFPNRSLANRGPASVPLCTLTILSPTTYDF